VRKALEPLPGVASVDKIELGKVTLTVVPGQFDEQKAIAALAEANYPGSSVEK
jgi:hypothetical protein